MNNLCVPSIAVDSPILELQRTVLLLNRRDIVVDDRDPVRLLDVVRVEIVVESNSLDAGILQRDAVDGPVAATLAVERPPETPGYRVAMRLDFS